MVEYLLSVGARCDLPDSTGTTALDEARNRNLQHIEALLLQNKDE